MSTPETGIQSCDTGQWVSIDQNMDVQYQVAGSHTRHKVWHFTSDARWCGRTDGRTATWLPKFLGYLLCFAELRSRARRVPLSFLKCISINLCLDPLLSSQVTCSNCNHESVKYQPFTFLSVPILSELYHTFGKYSYFNLDLFNRQCFKWLGFQ